MARSKRTYKKTTAKPTITGVQAPTVGMLTPEDIRRSANAMVDLQTRPQLNAIDRQVAQTQTQGAGISDRITQLYKNLGQSYTDQLGKFDAGAAASSTRLQGIGQARQAAITGAYGQANDRLAADNAVRGPGLDGGTSKALASQMGDAQANAAADTAFASTAQQQTSDAYRGLIQSMAANAPMRGAEAASAAGAETAKALGGLADKRTDVIGQGDAMRVKTINDLNQQAFTNYATVQGLNLKGDAQAIQLALGNGNLGEKYDALNNTAANQNVTEEQGDTRLDQGAERNKIAWSNHDLAQNKFDYQKRLASQLGKGGLKNLTPWQRVQVQKANSDVRGAIQSVGATGDALHEQKIKNPETGKYRSATSAEIRAALLKKYGNDTDVVNAGVALAHGTLKQHPELIQALKARHIGIPKAWLGKGPGNFRDTTTNPSGAGK